MKNLRDKIPSLRLALSLDDLLAGDKENVGLHIRDLDPLQGVRLQTRNHVYLFWILDPQEGHVLIRGGRFFPEFKEAYFCGSSWHGCFLKIGWIGIGMCLEMIVNGRRIVSSPVKSFTVENHASAPVAH